ncbi:MAG: hypothetical protein GWP33_05125 [Alphaproteobacteria bacterium]|nr:hypothetical protein [Alphaproteobacteria bacterium]
MNFWLQEHAKTAKAMQEGAKASLGCILAGVGLVGGCASPKEQGVT